MPKRSEKRDTAKAEYIAKKKKGEEVSLRALAGELGVSYQTLRNWKAADKWEEALPKKKRGGQPGNQNSKGKRNAAGSHDGAPPGNKNAEKDGAYSAVFFDMLSAEELKITESVPLGGREALEHEMKILKFREHKILAKIAEYESQPEDALFVSSLLDMRTPGGRGKDKKDGANQTMGMYSKDSAFSRVLKLQEALYKVQGRIAKIADSLRALEESDRRMALEKQRLEILRMRATGAVDVPDPDGTAADDLDAPLADASGAVSDAIADNGKTFKQNYGALKTYIQDLSTEIPRTTDQLKKKHKYKKVKKNKSASRAPAGESIEQRPEEIDEREEFGHWEGDTVYSGKGKRKTTRALLTLTERKTRKEIIIAIPNRKAETVVKALDALERKLGARRFRAIFKSITFDNGTEFAAAEELERSCVNKRLPRTKVYFCHPYSSWERGTNENTNGMIRRRFPKGTNFAAVTNAQIAQAENWINNYPRKILGYKSSEIVFRECLRELGIAA